MTQNYCIGIRASRKLVTPEQTIRTEQVERSGTRDYLENIEGMMQVSCRVHISISHIIQLYANNRYYLSSIICAKWSVFLDAVTNIFACKSVILIDICMCLGIEV